MIEIALLEDDATLRTFYSELIDSAADMHLCWASATIAGALDRLQRGAPDVLLADLALPDGSGLGLIDSTKARYPNCEILVVTIFGDDDSVVAAIEAGATGYLLKDALGTWFLNCIRELIARGSRISPSIARALLRRAIDADKLAARELEILALVSKGFNAPEIAQRLSIPDESFRGDVYRIYRKMSLH